jgi:phytoene dehydrogenase-like protein
LAWPRIEQLAPGFSQRIVARRILTALDMERRDASLIGGSINGDLRRSTSS